MTRYDPDDKTFDRWHGLSPADYKAIREAPSILDARAALDTRTFGMLIVGPNDPTSDRDIWPGLFE